MNIKLFYAFQFIKKLIENRNGNFKSWKERNSLYIKFDLEI